MNPWEPLGIVSLPDGERRFLTKTEEDSLAVMDDCGFAMPVGESETDEILSSLVPLGKLESLAIIVGGQTFHMGSEHGIREKVIAIVGTKGRAQEYSKKLRIGEDKEQGNEGVVLNLKQQGKIVAQVYVPLTTLFLLLGENGVKEVGAQLVGQTNKPIALNDEELLAFFGKQLLDDALDAKSDMSFFAEEKRYGIYS
ncbi:hypothetical protein HY358_01300 [Candidatus Roizmanbacteria bacterium]|nr:hypothetical protein [Candidatus Roizmanbacteria bacterium]